ncbi:hypothetical protein IV203_025458 [Nitzschia inconspicua]|uniref:Uncharacterized protein n=1 Tax=Nitzschia inconspicua TaxID=303405 RepID=A0A9K3PCA6_9STRA|nr:hypothetical protein IV203_028240 [Nitzschia inconspicua]KAG7362574.1 hypothetical protein IV203_025458 [Nitzschia inconspicua]
MNKTGEGQDTRKSSAPVNGPSGNVPSAKAQQSDSPAVTKKKAGKGSASTAVTNKTGKSNKTNKSNAPNRTKSSTATDKTKSNSTSNITSSSKKKSSPLPPAPRPPSNGTAAALVSVTANAPAMQRPSPAPPAQRKKAPTTQNHDTPKPPSFSVANPSLSGPQHLNKRSSHSGILQQQPPKSIMRAPSRPNSMVTDGNIPNRQVDNGQPLPPKTRSPMLRGTSQKANPSTPKPKVTSLPAKAIPQSTELGPRQPPRNKSLNLDDIAATESDSSGGSGKNNTTAGPFQGLLARTKSIMDDLMGSIDNFEDEPLNDSYGPGARRGAALKQSQRFSSRSSDHQGLATSSHHRRKNLPPPPTRGASYALGLGAGSLHGGSNHSVDFFSSSSTVLTRTEEPHFEDDPFWKRSLRFLRLLPPSPHERLVDRKIRILLWASLVLDFINAVVAITTFSEVTMCCGKPIWSMGGGANWPKAMTIISYIYIFGIFVEIVPVVRDSGIPWNILNPLFGFLLTFAVFFDDSRAEAISMWIIETISVAFDFVVYRLKRKKRMEKEELLDTINEKLEPFFASNRKANGFKGMDVSFHEAAIAAMEENTVADHREIKLLRERRQLRHFLTEEQKYLNYHLAGIVFNSGLMFITMIFIIAMLSTGGMCVYDDKLPNPFSQNQLGLCSSCRGVAGQCAICTATITQCYFPY